jgi:(E)-4-hydroxy-3-methylbut-2-enyl-diphosphate synthase
MKNQKKFTTREVLVGNIAIGKNNPIRIQSMTNTKTEDIQATINQILQLYDCGCEIVRLTVQGKKQAFALEKIKNLLLKKNCTIPLVADIHFYPPAAFIAADFVEKIRINPGNFAEKRAVFQKKILTDKLYQQELEKIEEKLFLLIEKLKINKTALRIGVNYGSLSDRIMTKYGNTVKAMIISAIEYANIFRKYNYHDIIFSMKASSAFLMIEAYKALIEEMIKLNWNYPLHLGVTEAGDLEDGIIKSSAGIGALLLDGIGDTIRVSLTAHPIKEIKPAKQLIELCKNRIKNKTFHKNIEKNSNKIFLAIKPKSDDLTDNKISMVDIFFLDNSNIYLKEQLKIFNKPLFSNKTSKDIINIYSLDEISGKPLKNSYVLKLSSSDDLENLKTIKIKPLFIIYKPLYSYIENIRKFSAFIKKKNINIPVIINLQYDQKLEDIKILATSEIGLILYEKLANGILLETKYNNLELSLNILQACKLKRYKAEFISCPGCGRTLFDIQATVKKIKEKMPSSPDIKIAIMGCIVNGPGEMQDADFGYVGSSKGKVDLYVNKICIEKNIQETKAVEKLIFLIKEKK